MPQQPAAAVRVPSGGASGKVGSGHSTYCAASTAVLPTLLTTRPRQVGTGVELAAKRYGADPRYQARALPRSLPPSGPTLLRPCSHAPRACICFEPCLPFARAHAVHVPGLPRRHPAALPNAGQPSQDLLAWLKKQQASGPREQWTVSLPVAPLLRRHPASVLFCGSSSISSESRVRACLPSCGSPSGPRVR